jgi:rubrerythrin
VDIDRYLSDGRSRRSFFGAVGVGVAGGSAVFLAACGSDDSSGGSGSQPVETVTDDAAILNQALALEQLAVAAYTLAAPMLTGPLGFTARHFLDQEQQHADGLAEAIRRLGAQPVRARTSYDFPSMSSQDDVLRFAGDIENTAVAAYIDALPKLQDRTLRATVASIVTDEAEHIAVLLGARHRQQAPSAFVSGKA